MIASQVKQYFSDLNVLVQKNVLDKTELKYEVKLIPILP